MYELFNVFYSDASIDCTKPSPGEKYGQRKLDTITFPP